MKKLIFLTLAGGMALALSACGGGGGGGGGVAVVVPSSPPDANAKYGAGFAADFKASSSATPASVSAGDVVPVDPTAKPSTL